MIQYQRIPKLIILFVVLFWCLSVSKANIHEIDAKILLLTIHVSDNAIQRGEEYYRKLSADGRFVITPGLEIDYTLNKGSDVLGIDAYRFTIGGYYDSMNHKSGYVAIMPRWKVKSGGRLEISFGLGLALIFRESWNTIPWYRDNGLYKESDKFLPGYQYRFIPCGDLSMYYKISSRLSGVWSIFPGIPYVITNSLGLQFSF